MSIEGIISSDMLTDMGIPPGNVKITVHDKGIRLKNDYNKAVMDIHSTQLMDFIIHQLPGHLTHPKFRKNIPEITRTRRIFD
ncbi:MAG: hypothetical protein ACWGNV_10065 [Bacteroidales bacterium]